ncbi:MAG TPA: TrmH family RNA methyltransferase, partial [Gaiellaceae bacterium]|nr:TrmH family RNA methyltransferase [Gaiellaceae bacterium]
MITSRDNATLKLVRKLLGQRKHRDETGLFAVEGEDLVDAARLAGVEPVHLLVAGASVEAELLAGVSTLPHPARAIGVYRRADLPQALRDTCLALWRLADPGNVGTLVRTADAFGAAVALSDGCADPLSPKALRASAGAIFRVPLVAWDAVPGRRVALAAHGGEPLGEADLT